MSNTALAVAGDPAQLARNETLTRAFFKAWERKDETAIVDAFAEDAFYHNVPAPFRPVVGKESIRKAVQKFLKTGDNMTFALNKLVIAGDSVVTERVDGWIYKGVQKSLPVMGILEFNAAGKLASWREYFDVKTMTGESA